MLPEVLAGISWEQVTFQLFFGIKPTGQKRCTAALPWGMRGPGCVRGEETEASGVNKPQKGHPGFILQLPQPGFLFGQTLLLPLRATGIS